MCSGNESELSRLKDIDVYVITTCHNRVEKSLACFQSIISQEMNYLNLQIFVVDDGSLDDTSKSLSELDSRIRVIQGDGALYWGGGMRRAQEVALENGNPDYLLWINDDVVLDRNAFSQLFNHALNQHGLIVGSVRETTNFSLLYGGYRRSGNALSLELVSPSSLTTVDTFNGNVVLIPREVYTKVGSVDKNFTHLFGDIDYGYRCGKAGFKSFVFRGFVGTCDANTDADTWRDSSLKVLNRLRLLHSAKGVPIKAKWIFSKRYEGKFWFFIFLLSYLKHYIRILIGR